MKSAENQDHETIWLAPVCHSGQGDGRMWAEDNPFNGCDEDGSLCEKAHQPVQFVRADIADRHVREARRAAHREDAREANSILMALDEDDIERAIDNANRIIRRALAQDDAPGEREPMFPHLAVMSEQDDAIVSAGQCPRCGEGLDLAGAGGGVRFDACKKCVRIYVSPTAGGEDDGGCSTCNGTGYAVNCGPADRERGDLWACGACDGTGEDDGASGS